jgi:hypothetical protein
VRPYISVAVLTAAVCKCVELLGIAEIESGLIVDPGSQSALERTMLAWIEWTEWENIRRADAIRGTANDKRHRLVISDSNNCSIQTDADERALVWLIVWGALKFIERRLSPARKFHVHLKSFPVLPMRRATG